MNKKSWILKLAALLLICATLVPSYAKAAAPEPVDPLASHYITSCDGSYSISGSKLFFTFYISTSSNMSDLGIKTFYLYESTDNLNWSLVKLYTSGVYTNLMGHNRSYYSASLSYDYVPGRYYKAQVNFYAATSEDSETRTKWKYL